MTDSPPRGSNSNREAALLEYAILDTPPEEDFDDICRLASRICDTPIALVSFIDRNRQWFKSEIGLGVRETPLEHSICRHAILEDKVLMVPDTLQDARFSSNPLCAGDQSLRFYAGAKLQTAGGVALGTVCVLDRRPRHLDDSQIEALRMLARQVMTMLELRLRVAEAQAQANSLRESEERLRASEIRYRTLSEAASDIIWTNDANGEMRGEQPGWTRFTGQSVQEAQGYGWSLAVHPDDAQPTIDAWRAAVETRSRFDFEHRVRRHDGEWRAFRICAAPVMENGVLREWVGVHTNVTEIRRAEEKLREALDAETHANSAKDDFLAKLSHELRTPLMPVLMTAGDLLEQADLTPEIRRDVQSILRNAELEARLIDDLLDVTRIVHGKLELRIEDCDIHRLIEHAVQICAPAFRQRQIALTLRLEAVRNRVEGDPSRLQQVFWNLLTNAAKFAGASGRVEILTSDAGDDAVRIEVRDHGMGIEPERMRSLFSAFEQGGRSVTRRFGGLGLGLAICKGVVDAHSGRIWAESEGLGRGTVFHVQLAAGAGAAPGVSPIQPAHQRQTSAPPMVILLVEDHEPTAEILIRLMKNAGHRVEHARTISDATRKAGGERFDFVISDLGLPDGSGLELMAHLRDRHGLRGIALSGYGTHTDIAASREAGFHEHLIKPVDWKLLREAIAAHTPSQTPG